jgi:hypothetical protein
MGVELERNERDVRACKGGCDVGRLVLIIIIFVTG